MSPSAVAPLFAPALAPAPALSLSLSTLSCRRLLGMRAVTPWIFVVLLALGVGCKKKAPVGQACEGPKGCVDGADCLVVYAGVVPPIGATRGICYQRCVRDPECPSGQSCHDQHCRVLAPIDGRCDASVPCANGNLCVRFDGAAGATCRPKCLTHSDCKGNDACLPAAGADLTGRMMAGVPPDSVCQPPALPR